MDENNLIYAYFENCSRHILYTKDVLELLKSDDDCYLICEFGTDKIIYSKYFNDVLSGQEN